MPSQMFVQVQPPGPQKDLVCEKCGSNLFHLGVELDDEGDVQKFHTRCSLCNKRGALLLTVQTSSVLTFMQFEDPPKDLAESLGYTIMTPRGSSTTYTVPPVLGGKGSDTVILEG